MKLKHAIIILLLGYCIDFLATMFKITHAPGADLWLYSSNNKSIRYGISYL